jgi:hypothetical protein
MKGLRRFVVVVLLMLSIAAVAQTTVANIVDWNLKVVQTTEMCGPRRTATV